MISSELGVSFIRFCAISVYLEGNVIDLGRYKLQVVEACSGLRYLFPLASLAFISAYIFKGALWKKALIFRSAYTKVNPSKAKKIRKINPTMLISITVVVVSEKRLISH